MNVKIAGENVVKEMQSLWLTREHKTSLALRMQGEFEINANMLVFVNDHTPMVWL